MVCKDCGTYNYSGTIACVKCGADFYGKKKEVKKSSTLARAIRNFTVTFGMSH